MCFHKCTKHIPALLRVAIGWIFLWSFIDKVFGLGFSTKAGQAWLDGVSPTTGFLQFGTKGPLADVFQAMAGSVLVDWLFMLGLLFVGVALILGIGMKIAGHAGSLMLLLMWLALLTPEHNPVIDEHIVYILALAWLMKSEAGNDWGFGKWWKNIKIVKNNVWLQ